MPGACVQTKFSKLLPWTLLTQVCRTHVPDSEARALWAPETGRRVTPFLGLLIPSRMTTHPPEQSVGEEFRRRPFSEADVWAGSHHQMLMAGLQREARSPGLLMPLKSSLISEWASACFRREPGALKLDPQP